MAFLQLQTRQIYSVRYDQVNAMLLNEFLKEHSKVEQLEVIVARQEKRFVEQEERITKLTAGLQKMSAQLEASGFAPQTVVDNH